MAYAQVEDRLTQTFASSTTHNVTMPTTVNNGDILVICLSMSNFSLTAPTGWKSIHANLAATFSCRLLIKIADGTEGGTTVNFATSGSTAMITILYRVSGGQAWDIGHFTTASRMDGYASTTTPDPATLTTHDAAQENLWLTFLQSDNGLTVNSAPTNFTNLTQIGGGTGVMAGAEREDNVQSENPGTWSCSSTAVGSTVTLVIHPSVAGYPYLVDFSLQSVGSTQVVFTPTFPVPDGDLMLAWVDKVDTGSGISLPAGWTAIYSSTTGSARVLAYKIASSESGSYTFSWSGSSIARGQWLHIKGVRSGDELDNFNQDQDASDPDTTIVVPSFTLDDDCTLFGFASDRGGESWGTQPSGWQEIVPGPNTENGHGSAFLQGVSAGATGSVTFTHSSTGATTNAIVVGIKANVVAVFFEGWGFIPI